ncbi:MAG: MFS transporter [Rhodoluna sp.]
MSSKKSGFKVRELIFPVYLPAALFSISEGGLMPIIPASAERLGADLPTAAFVTGLLMFGTVFADLPAAKLVNRLGERRSMIAASIFGAIGLAISFLATNLFVLSAGLFVVGAAAAVFGLARHAYVTETVPFEFRARALSLLGGMFRLGMFVGPLIGAGLYALGGIVAVYVMSISFALAAGVFLLFTNPEKMPDTELHTGAIWTVAKKNRKELATLGVAAAILALARTVRNIGLPLWALHIGLDAGQASLFIGIAGALDFALFYVGGKAIDKRGRKFAAVPTYVATGIGLAILAFTFDGSTFILAALFLSVANAMGSGLIMVIGADLAPDRTRNQFLAAYRLMLDGGIAVAAPSLSILTLFFGLGTGIIALGGVSVFGGYLMARYLPKFGIK